MGIESINATEALRDTSSKTMHKKVTKTMLDVNPPINPSMVLFGLSSGRNEFLPKFFPIMYAPLSNTATLKITINKNSLDPLTN